MPKYKVMVDDNFHYMDESERYTLGTFDSLQEAVSAAQQIVDEYLSGAYSPGMQSSDLVSSYKAFGEDPFILTDDPTPVQFSAWTYAEQRCAEICKPADPSPPPTTVIGGANPPIESVAPDLISPELDLSIFCYRVIHKNPIEILDSATTEMWKARRHHYSKTGRREFRIGSRGHQYCADLQLLVSMLTNGTVPLSASDQFRATVRPLVHQLLTRWNIGTLRNEFGADA